MTFDARRCAGHRVTASARIFPGSGYGTGSWFEEAAAGRLFFVFAPTLTLCRSGRADRSLGGPADLTDEGLIRVANIKSQIKRNKQNEKAHQRNKAVKSELRTHVRKFREAVEAGNVEEATVALRVASRKLDKAVSKGVIHKNQAANRKSAIAKRLTELQQA
jgi:small subunit ribosomal protein S20